MKRAILPLLLIITMVLSVSVAYADDLPDTSTVNAWTVTSGAFATNGLDDGLGVTTNTSATATHPVSVGSDGIFSFQAGVQLNDLKNGAMIGVTTDTGVQYTLEFAGGIMYVKSGTNTVDSKAVDFTYTDGTIIKLESLDGANVNYDIGGINGAFPADGIPTSIAISLTNDPDNSAGPVIYSLSFTAPGHPSINDMPAAPTESYDIKKVQGFYNNVYPVLFGQQGNVGMTPAATVSGTITSAADGNAIVGASVVLGDATQKTDYLGNFKFTGVSMGAADLAVSADGFASQTLNVNVNGDLTKNIALVKAGAGSSVTASAANETANTTVTNTTVTNTTTATTNTTAPTAAPTTTAPSPTQTKSPGFEGIIAAIAMIGAAGVLVYVNRKH